MRLLRHNRWLIIFFLWLAFGLRVWGLSFGLPYKFHPDEDKYVDAALAWHTAGQMDLELINPPLFTYILGAGLAVSAKLTGGCSRSPVLSAPTG